MGKWLLTLLVFCITHAAARLIHQSPLEQELNIKLKDRYDLPDMWKRMGFTHGAEIGVWKGDFAHNTLTRMPGLVEYILVDPWRHQEDWNKPFNRQDDEFEAIYKEAMGKTADSPVGQGRVKVKRGTSLEQAKTVPNNSLDFVYIDGDHTLNGALTDIMLWYPKVKSGGVIFGDDYVDGGQHGSKFDPTMVKSVVDTFARAVRGKLFDLGQRQFALIKPEDSLGI